MTRSHYRVSSGSNWASPEGDLPRRKMLKLRSFLVDQKSQTIARLALLHGCECSYTATPTPLDRPLHRELAMLKSYAEQRASQNVVLQNRDPPLGLRTPVLDLL